MIEDVILDKDARVLGFTLGKVYAAGPLAERKAVARQAVTALGSKEVPMTIDLVQAEALEIPTA